MNSRLCKQEGRKDGKGEMAIHAFTELKPFVESLRVPRRILLSIPAGKPVEMTIEVWWCQWTHRFDPGA